MSKDNELNQDVKDRDHALEHVVKELGPYFSKALTRMNGNPENLIMIALPILRTQGWPDKTGVLDLERLGLTAEEAADRKRQLAEKTSTQIAVGGTGGVAQYGTITPPQKNMDRSY